MVSYCCVKRCTNNSNSAKKNSRTISFHAFPSKSELRQKWLRAIGRPYWDPPSYVRICSIHFSVDQINNDGTRIRIKEEACPVEELPPANSISASDVKVCRICLATDVRLFGLEYGKLKVCMETLAELNDNHDILDLPQFVCCECGVQLLKYNRLIEKSLIAQATLLDIFADNGRITKRLVKQKDRKELNLHSTMGYSESAAVITLNYGNNNDSSDHFIINDDETKFDVCKDEVDMDSENNVRSNKNNGKERINRLQLSQDVNNDANISNKTVNGRLDSNVTNVTLNEDLDKKDNVKLKTEVLRTYVDSDTADYDMEKLDFKTVDKYTDSKHRNNTESMEPLPNKRVSKTLKIEVDIPKYEKIDTVTENVTENCKRSKESKKSNSTSNTKPQRMEYCDIGKLNSDTEDIKEIFERLNKVLKSSDESDCNIEDAALNDDSSNSDSSDNEVLQNLKNNAKYKKLAENVKAKKTKSRASKKKTGDKTTPEETAIAKLKCYKIVDISLQDQIDAWNTENQQPTQYSQFQCEICTRKFVRKKAYDEHLPRHDSSRGDFECPVCKERFRNKTRFYAHITRNHAKKYECQKCPKVFYNLDKAQRHEVFHSGQVYSCPHCAYSTTRRSTAWEHVRTQHAHAHHCALCGHTFINAKGLGTHKAMLHQGQDEEPKTPFPCEQCNIVFHSEGALRVHKLVSVQHKSQEAGTESPAARPTCRRCGAVFARPRELWAHTQQAHRPPARRACPRARPGADQYPRPCDHCSTELQSRFDHWCHVRRSHPEHKHLYRSVVAAVCAVCGKGFQSKTMLSRHEQKHLGPATLACAACPRAFHDACALRRHARAHAAQRAHACPDCGRAFKVKGNLERHRRYAHAPESPFLCTECGRAFKVKSNFKRHLRMHTGETPYECKYCGKKFRYWESLTLHERHMHQKVPWPARDRTRAKRAPHAAD